MSESIESPSPLAGEGRGEGAPASIKAALLDAAGVYQGMVELASESELTAHHVPASEFGGDCDLPPGRYRWNAQAKRFDALPPKTPEQKFADVEPLPAVAADMIHRWTLDHAALPEQTLAWLDGYVLTFDFKTILQSSAEAQDYVRSRGLTN